MSNVTLILIPWEISDEKLIHYKCLLSLSYFSNFVMNIFKCNN